MLVVLFAEVPLFFRLAFYPVIIFNSVKVISALVVWCCFINVHELFYRICD
jgi:hypothetical protein